MLTVGPGSANGGGFCEPESKNACTCASVVPAVTGWSCMKWMESATFLTSTEPVASRVNDRAAAARVARSGPSTGRRVPGRRPGGPGGGGGHVGDDADSTTAGRGIGHPDGGRGAAVLVVATSRGGAGAGDAWWPVGRDSPVRFPGCPAVIEPCRGAGRGSSRDHRSVPRCAPFPLTAVDDRIKDQAPTASPAPVPRRAG